MKIAIMQPYLFPYLGYFQLLQAADKFIIYDDVNFIKQGWINRNYILLNKQKHLFTVPLEQANSFARINETKISQKLYAPWLLKFEKTLVNAYRKAPFFESVFPLVTNIFEHGKQVSTIAELSAYSILSIKSFLELRADIQHTSSVYGNHNLSGASRVMDICRAENASAYINPVGGMELYSKEDFKKQSLELFFLQMNSLPYPQFDNEFIPYLSVIDCMMFNSQQHISTLLNSYTLN